MGPQVVSLGTSKDTNMKVSNEEGKGKWHRDEKLMVDKVELKVKSINRNKAFFC